MFRLLPIGAFIILLAANGLAGEPAATRGAEILAPFKMQLKQALLAGLAQGPGEAIGACRLQAPAIAAELSVDGVAVGRTSHRLRNPVNAAPDWVEPVLQAYVDDANDRAPRTVRLAADLVGYVEPIVTQPLCLTCHGDVQDPALAARIKDEYPEDEATGFQPGDLRGVFWVTYPEIGQTDE